MKYKKKSVMLSFVIAIFIFLFLINLVVAQPPFQQSEFVEGQLIIETSYPEFHKLGEDYYVHVHVYNGSTGLLVKDGISCRYHFYNHQMKGGEHISIGNLHSYGDGFYVNVTGTLLNTTGQYSVLSWCNSSSEGGFFKYTFTASPNARGFPSGVVIVVYTILFMIVFAFAIIYFFKALGNAVTLEMELMDTVILITSYLTVWIFYYFSNEFLGNEFMNGIFEVFISVGAFTHVFLPLVMFALSFMLTNLKFKQRARVTY